MVDAGLVVLTVAFISPHRAEAVNGARMLGDDRFIEVFVDTPLAICEARIRGLYKKARAGELRNSPSYRRARFTRAPAAANPP